MAKEILIVDPDKAVQEEFHKIFEATDYNLVFSESGEHALLRIKLFKPDLIIAGASLKEKSGFDVCKAIKTDPECKHIPVILISNIFQEISDEDRKRVRADGVITRPFHEDQILNLVDRLMEEGEMGEKKEEIFEREAGLKSVAQSGETPLRKEEEFLLDEIGETEDEEVIELVDVVEEPELKRSIEDFVPPEKETPFTGITPLESWEKLMEEERPADRRFKSGPHEKELEAKGLRLQLGEETTLSRGTSETELLEKIELEEILQEVEQLTPAIEKEWPPELRKEAPEAALPSIEEPPEKYEGLAEFEAALKRGIGAEPMEEEVPKSLFEELGGEGVGGIGELEEEGIEIFEELEVPEPLKEEIGVFEKLEEERVELFEEIEAPEVPREEVRVVEKPKEERVEIFEEVTAPVLRREEMIPPSRAVERQVEEIISKGAREMMEGFITKLVPEITQSIINLTIERIERMVREIVPEIAEKMIQEEIKRLQKGEKE